MFSFVPLLITTTLTVCATYTNGLIIPEELPSLLQLIYSKIPPIKKGTDSRFGIGFRLGPHADFQMMFEVGPQTNTNPIGPDGLPPGKRETLQMDNTQTLVEMVNHWKMPENTESAEAAPTNQVISDSPGGGWIESWKNAFQTDSYFGKIQFKKVPGIDNRRNSQEYFVDRLKKLHEMASINACQD